MHALILGEVAACHSIWQTHWQQVRRLLDDKAGGPSLKEILNQVWGSA